MNLTLQRSIVEACRAQLLKISGAGFSARWQEGLSRTMSFTWHLITGSVFAFSPGIFQHFGNFWFTAWWASWIPPGAAQPLMELKPTSEFWVPKSQKTWVPGPGRCLWSFLFERKAQWIKTWDFPKRGSHLVLDTAVDTRVWGMLLNVECVLMPVGTIIWIGTKEEEVHDSFYDVYKKL